MPRRFKLDRVDERPITSLTDVITRAREFRRIGAFWNALDLYKRFEVRGDLAALADDAWMGRDLETCLEALTLVGDTRELLHCADVLEPHGLLEWVARYRNAAARIDGAKGVAEAAPVAPVGGAEK
jgi:hypothetical protein